MVKIHFILLLSLMAFQQGPPAYLLYDKEGEKVNYEKMIAEISDADVILFGEVHNNPISHWLQLQVIKSLFEKNGQELVIAAEMFEADNQLVINEYLSGTIKETNFKSEAKLWNNYDTDYAPIVEFAQKHGLPVVASNVPRRYASLVSKSGLPALDSLSKEAKQYIAPLPLKVDLSLPGYKNMMDMMEGHGGGFKAENFAHAQAVKDATMAYFIVKNRGKNKKVIHLNGRYHSDNYEGIGWYLKETKPKLKVATISTVEQENVSELEDGSKGLADFIICIPSDMTKTYKSQF